MKSSVWSDVFAEALRTDVLYRAILSRSLTASAMQKVTIRPIELQGQRQYQWTSRVGTQERHENLSSAEVTRRVSQQFAIVWGDLHWFAEDGDYTVRWKPPGKAVMKRKPPTQSAPQIDHNRTRNYLIPEGTPCPFLIAAGIMTSSGQVKPTAFHKFRQINRYLEFIADILPHLPADGVIRAVDFGCGKSSLTFALHHFLTVTRGRNVQIVGLDRKADVIAACNETAVKLGCQGLSFSVGDIAGYQPKEPVDLAISLHACDTATDDAIAAAIGWKSAVILAVPCCQHELGHHWSGALPGMTGYGLLKERFAAMATDALRARFLEAHGYHTQVLEFIETEHTPKNVLIRAVRHTSTESDQRSALAEYQNLKQELGVQTWHLETVCPS